MFLLILCLGQVKLSRYIKQQNMEWRVVPIRWGQYVMFMTIFFEDKHVHDWIDNTKTLEYKHDWIDNTKTLQYKKYIYIYTRFMIMFNY